MSDGRFYEGMNDPLVWLAVLAEARAEGAAAERARIIALLEADAETTTHGGQRHWWRIAAALLRAAPPVEETT